MDYISGGHLTFTGKACGLLLFLFITPSFSKISNTNIFFGVSRVFKAQVYTLPDLNSVVLTYLDKGEKIKVHPKHFKEENIKNKLEDQKIDLFENKLGFYQIITSKGTIGFIEKNHIYLIYQDFRDQHYHFQTKLKTISQTIE